LYNVLQSAIFAQKLDLSKP